MFYCPNPTLGGGLEPEQGVIFGSEPVSLWVSVRVSPGSALSAGFLSDRAAGMCGFNKPEGPEPDGPSSLTLV